MSSVKSLASGLFDELAKIGDGRPGVCRDAYGKGENEAHAVIARHGEEQGLEVSQDHALNTYVTLPGKDRSSPAIVIGSHLDSVASGGNFDGAAGVVAGICAIETLRSRGVQAACDITTMGIRAEESAWFPFSYIGSRAALGLLPAAALDVRRTDTGRTLEDHMREAGADVESIRRGKAHISSSTVRAFIEPHIEQGPRLVKERTPFAIATAVPGIFRYPAARVVGAYDHVGLVRNARSDAVFAASELVGRLDQLWDEAERNGTDLCITVGKLHTSFKNAAMTKVPGECDFTLDVRAYTAEKLQYIEAAMLEWASDIERRRRVRFEFGEKVSTLVATTDDKISTGLQQAAQSLGTPCLKFGSPGTHDSAAFHSAGVPIAMMLIRNENGSHNPDEHMDIDDFCAVVDVLSHYLEHAHSA